MGPRDPMGGVALKDAPDAVRSGRLMPDVSARLTARRAVGVGFALGSGLALCLLLGWLAEFAIVLVGGLLGAAVGRLVYGIWTQELDFEASWRALRGDR